MPERNVTAQPDIVPAPREDAGTMFAALYGELALHAWHDPEHDPYQLFHQRAFAMGWLDDTDAGGHYEDDMVRASGLWGMNDAGWNHPYGHSETELISWFQVDANAVAGDRPLPVQPFLRCAEDATARAGRPNLSAIQLLLPVQGLRPSSRPPYAPVPAMQSVHWFAERDPRSRTSVEVSINSGRDPSIPAVATQLTDHLSQLDQDVFVCSSHDLAGREAVLPPPFDDRLWNGPALHGVMLRGELAEWSCDVVGWLAEVVADSVAQLGIRSPLLFTVSRALSMG